MAIREIGRQWQLSDLLEGVVRVPSAEDRPVSGLTLDSRSVTRGNLFLACAGAGGHGLDFFAQALERGAAAVLCQPKGEWPQGRIDVLRIGTKVPVISVHGLDRRVAEIAARFYGDPSRHLNIIGVTGTNGKTSCSQFLARALEATTPCGVIGTLGNGFPGALEAGTHTTPEPVALQAILADLLRQGAQAVAMEVSSHALEQGRTGAVCVDTAVLTNLSRDHLDFHGTMEAYAAAKLRLFKQKGLRCAVLNLDDPFGSEVLAALPERVEAVAYGLGEPDRPLPNRVGKRVWAAGITPGSEGMTVRVHTSWGEGVFHTPLLGRFNVSNLLAVLAVLLERGLALDEALRRLEQLETVPGRMEHFGGGEQPVVVVDYAHTPDALGQVLLTLREHSPGRLFCLFGCGGDRDAGKRPRMGAVAEALSDEVILTDDNPRREDGGQIIEQILAGMKAPGRVTVERRRGEAIRRVIAGAGSGDLVAVCGKGHETYQQVGELRTPFSDREAVVQALAGERP